MLLYVSLSKRLSDLLLSVLAENCVEERTEETGNKNIIELSDDQQEHLPGLYSVSTICPEIFSRLSEISPVPVSTLAKRKIQILKVDITLTVKYKCRALHPGLLVERSFERGLFIYSVIPHQFFSKATFFLNKIIQDQLNM